MESAASRPRARRFLRRGLLALGAGLTWLALSAATANADELKVSSAVPPAPGSAVVTMIQFPKADDPIAPVSPAPSAPAPTAPAVTPAPVSPPASPPAVPVPAVPAPVVAEPAVVQPVVPLAESDAPPVVPQPVLPVAQPEPASQVTETPAPVPPVSEPVASPPAEPAPAPAPVPPGEPAPAPSSDPAPVADPAVPVTAPDTGAGDLPAVPSAPEPAPPVSGSVPGTVPPATPPAVVPVPVVVPVVVPGQVGAGPAPLVPPRKTVAVSPASADPLLKQSPAAVDRPRGLQAVYPAAGHGYVPSLTLPDVPARGSLPGALAAGNRTPASPRSTGDGAPAAPTGGNDAPRPRGGDTGLPAPAALPPTPGSGSGSGSTSSGPSGAAAWTPSAFFLIPPMGTDPISGPLQHVHPAVAADPGSSPD